MPNFIVVPGVRRRATFAVTPPSCRVQAKQLPVVLHLHLLLHSFPIAAGFGGLGKGLSGDQHMHKRKTCAIKFLKVKKDYNRCGKIFCCMGTKLAL